MTLYEREIITLVQGRLEGISMGINECLPIRNFLLDTCELIGTLLDEENHRGVQQE